VLLASMKMAQTSDWYYGYWFVEPDEEDDWYYWFAADEVIVDDTWVVYSGVSACTLSAMGDPMGGQERHRRGRPYVEASQRHSSSASRLTAGPSGSRP